MIAARRFACRQRPSQRRVALRLQPRHLRRGRLVRPVAGQGLRPDPRSVVEGRRPPRSGLMSLEPARHERPARSGVDGSRPGLPGDGRAEQIDAFRLGPRAVRHPGVEGACPRAQQGRPAVRCRSRDDARRTRLARRRRRESGAFGPAESPTRTYTAPSNAGSSSASVPTSADAFVPAAPATTRSRRCSACGFATRMRRVAGGTARRRRRSDRPGEGPPGRDHAGQDPFSGRAAGAAGAPPARSRPSVAARHRSDSRLRQAGRDLAVRLGCARWLVAGSGPRCDRRRTRIRQRGRRTRSMPRRRVISLPRPRSCSR